MDEQLAIFKEVDGFVCPAEFWPALGYEGSERYVALWWEQCGDEASWNDGLSSVVGAYWPAYLRLIDHNFPLGHAGRWLLGSSETPAAFHLVIDRETERAWLVPTEDVEELLHDQWTAADEANVLLQMLASLGKPTAQHNVESKSTADVTIDTSVIGGHLALQYAYDDAFTAALEARRRARFRGTRTETDKG